MGQGVKVMYRAISLEWSEVRWGAREGGGDRGQRLTIVISSDSTRGGPAKTAHGTLDLKQKIPIQIQIQIQQGNAASMLNLNFLFVQ
jgi:hypothetical protein